MQQSQLKTVTLLYYCDNDLMLHHKTIDLPTSDAGRVIIPEHLKLGRSIIAVCEGKVEILNKLGERIMPLEGAA